MPDGSWKREGPEEMMVSVDSARQWYPREKLIACDTDHSHIAKLKRGENSIYPDIRSAIQQAMLSVGVLYNEAEGHHDITRPDQAYKADVTSNNRGKVAQSHPLRMKSQLTHHKVGQPNLQSHHTFNTRDNGNLGGSLVTHHLNPSSTNYPHGDNIDQNISQWRLDLGDEQCANKSPQTSPSVSSGSAMDPMVSGTHHTAMTVADSVTSVGTDNIQLYSPALQTSRQKDQIRLHNPAFTRVRKSKDGMAKDDTGGWSILRREQPPLTDVVLAAEPREVGTSQWNGPEPETSPSEPQASSLEDTPRHEPVEVSKIQQVREIEQSVSTSTNNPHPTSETIKKDSKSTIYDDPLKIAIKEGHVETVEELLTTRFDVNCNDDEGFTPLHHATLYRNEFMVKFLLEHGAYPRAKTRKGYTPLHTSCIELSASNPLSESLIDLLLQHRPPLEEVNDTGWTPIMYAVIWNERLLVERLISCGASVLRTDISHDTALHIAAETAKGPNIISLLIKEGALLEAVNKWKQTPLMRAARAGQIMAVKCLLHAGADKEAKSSIGYTPLLSAAQAGSAGCVELLLLSGADVKAEVDGNTALHCAAMFALGPVTITLLIMKGANLNARNMRKMTPLHFAVLENRVEAANALLQAGADKETLLSATLLHIAARTGSGECAELLLSSGANIEAEAGWDRETSLHWAVEHGKLHIVKILIARGANPLARSKGATGGRIPRDISSNGRATAEVMKEISDILKEAEVAWKRSGKKYSKFRLGI